MPAVSVTIYHNPRCSKSRATLELLRRRDIEPRIIAYVGDQARLGLPPERVLEIL